MDLNQVKGGLEEVFKGLDSHILDVRTTPGSRDFFKQDRLQAAKRCVGAARYLLASLDLIDLGIQEMKAVSEDSVLKAILEPKPLDEDEVKERKRVERQQAPPIRRHTKSKHENYKDVLAFLRNNEEGLTTQEISRKTGIVYGTTHSTLQALCRDGLVTKESRGVYIATPCATWQPKKKA